MKFREIPQFTQKGSYQVNMGLEFLMKTIEDWEQNDNLQLNPDFQRGHVWTEEQQIKFIEFLLRGGDSGRVLYFNQPGWMYDFTGEFVCVDGLQRITAIKKFISNEIPAFGTYYNEYEDNLDDVNINMIVNINNLKTRKEVLQWYLEMNDGGTPHSKEEIDRVKMMLEEL